MTTPKAKSRAKTDGDGLDAGDVASWLEAHPDFFSGRDSLLLKMELPHSHSTNNGEAISLVERQVSLLRERGVDARKQLDEFVFAARENNETYVKSQRLILSLIDAKDANSFFKALEDSFKKEFKSDAYSLIIFSEYAQQVNHFTSSIPIASAQEYVGGLMKSKEPFLGALRQSEQDFLFRHSSSSVKSAAVLPLRSRRHIAMLAIGSSNPDYFKSGMGTIFIKFIGDVIARLLPRYVYLDPK